MKINPFHLGMVHDRVNDKLPPPPFPPRELEGVYGEDGKLSPEGLERWLSKVENEKNSSLPPDI